MGAAHRGGRTAARRRDAQRPGDVARGCVGRRDAASRPGGGRALHRDAERYGAPRRATDGGCQGSRRSREPGPPAGCVTRGPAHRTESAHGRDPPGRGACAAGASRSDPLDRARVVRRRLAPFGQAARSLGARPAARAPLDGAGTRGVPRAPAAPRAAAVDRAGRSAHGNWLASTGDSHPCQRNLRTEHGAVGSFAGSRACSYPPM